MKVTGNTLPDNVVRLGDKVYINIEPKDISYIDDNNNNISLFEYEQLVLPHTVSDSIIQETIRINSTDYITRKKRDSLLGDSDKKVARYRDEVELGIIPTTDDLVKLTNYRQYLRDIPNEEGFPYITIKTYEEFIL